MSRFRLLAIAFVGVTTLVAASCVTPGGGGSPPVNPPPVAAIDATPLTGSVPLLVDFDGSGSTDNGSITSYSWNFGDGSAVETGVTQSHTYLVADTYTATLTVTDNQGATDFETVSIVVTTVPNVPPVAVADVTPTSGFTPLRATFSSDDSTDSDGTITTYSWDFGDGSPLSSDANPTHVYTAPGTYTATLTVTDDDGAPDSATTSTITVTDDPAGRYVATTGTDTGTCSSSAAPCLTVNYAIAQAATGDSVYVAAGTYPEKVLTSKALKFRGANAGVNAGIGAGTRDPESIVKSIQANGTAFLDITVDGFRIEPQGDATMYSTATTLVQLVGGTTGTTIVNNVIAGHSSYIPACNFTCTVVGQQMAFGDILVRSGPTTISNNRIEKTRYGIKLTQNTALNPLVATVSNNVITEVTIQGMGIGGVTGVQQPGSTITGNAFDAVGRLSGPGGIVITNGYNTITGNSFTDFGSGVYVSACKKWDTRGLTVDNNTFNLAGITVESSQDGGQCILGTGSNTEGVGSWVTGGGRVDGFNANGNSFTGTNSGARFTLEVRWTGTMPVTPGPLDLTCNYWDSATGPTNSGNPSGTGRPLNIGASPTPAITFSPWNTASGGPCDGSL